MKKIFLYTMLACMAVSFGSCSDDPMDATEKHVYGENENPYLRTDASATELFCFFAYVDNTLVSPFYTYISET